jgi:hypothetical protein
VELFQAIHLKTYHVIWLGTQTTVSIQHNSGRSLSIADGLFRIIHSYSGKQVWFCLNSGVGRASQDSYMKCQAELRVPQPISRMKRDVSCLNATGSITYDLQMLCTPCFQTLVGAGILSQVKCASHQTSRGSPLLGNYHYKCFE